MEWFINDFYKSFIILKVNYTDCSFFTISVIHYFYKNIFPTIFNKRKGIRIPTM